MTVSDAGTTLIRRVFDEICNDGRLEVADELFASDYVNHGGLIADLVRGPEAVKVSIALHRHAFPGTTFDIENVRTCGRSLTCDWVASRAQSTCRDGRGSIAAAGELRGQLLCHIVDGQIAESWLRWDRAESLRQLGFVALPFVALPTDADSGQRRGRAT